MFVLGAVATSLDFGLSRIAYPDAGPGLPAFTQIRIDGRFFTEYRFTDSFAANATVQYNQASEEIINQENLGFTRWQAYLGVRWFM